MRIFAILTVVYINAICQLALGAKHSNRKVGGIRFIKCGRMTVSISMAKA